MQDGKYIKIAENRGGKKRARELNRSEASQKTSK